MSRFTKQQLLDALHSLPQSLKDIILSAERAEVFQDIMERQGLTVAQIATVASELAPVTYGLILPEELPLNLKRRLPELPQGTLDALVEDINVHLLKNIRDHVVALAHQDTTDGAASPDIQPAAVAAPRMLVTDIAQAKLSGGVHLPSDAVKVTEPANPHGAQNAPAAHKPPSPIQVGRYAEGNDPYREST